MLPRSGCSGGDGLGSCLFVPEGPAIFITSSVQFPGPVSQGLFSCRMRSISTQPLEFLRVLRAVTTEGLLRHWGISESWAASDVQFLPKFTTANQLHPSGNLHVKHYRKHSSSFHFLLSYLTSCDHTKPKIGTWMTWGFKYVQVNPWNDHQKARSKSEDYPDTDTPCPTLSGNFIVGDARTQFKAWGRKPKWEQGLRKHKHQYSFAKHNIPLKFN